VRPDNARQALIDRAAASLGRSPAEFMLEAATQQARSVLLDHQFLELGESAIRRLTRALDAEPGDNCRLRALMARRTPWEERPSTG